MPGITGIYLKRQTNLEINDLNLRMIRTVNYEDRYKIDSIVDERVIFNRISLGILNPEPQPVYNEDKSLWIIMEGEIYDYQMLKKDLMLKGHKFSLNNDPEFILHLYEDHREDFGDKLKSINGIFLGIIYDKKINKLIVFNDRYGLKPLYWCDRGDYFLFSSEIKAILQDKGLNRELELKAIAEFFSFGYVLGDKTFIKDVNLFSPASIFICSGERNEIERYWSWNRIKKIKVNDEEEIIGELYRLWLLAVGRRLEGKGKIGLTLSGGLDSRAIVAAISPNYFPIHAVTFGKKNCDDYKIAKKVSDILGIKHYFVEITGENWISGIEKTVYISDGLLNVIHQHSWSAIDAMKTFFDINLNGFAGDLVIGGSYLEKEFLNIENIDKHFEKVFFTMNSDGISINDENEFYDTHMINKMRKSSYYSLAKEIKHEINNCRDSDYFFLNNRVRRFTLMGTVCSQTKLENRKPFFDNEFIDFVYSLPNELRYRHYIYNKMLLKYFSKVYESIPWQKTGLPIGTNKIYETLYTYFRKGKNKINKLLQLIGGPLTFMDNINFADYNRLIRDDEIKQYITNIILSPRALDRGYFNQGFIKQIVDSHMQRKKNNAQIIGLLLTFEIFNRIFIDGDKVHF